MRNISKLILLFLAVFTSSQFSSAQKTRYQRVMGGDKDDNNYSIDRTLDGGFILTGYTTSYGSGGEDAYLIKTNALGAVEWTKAYGSKANEIGWSVKATQDSGFIVCGTSGSSGIAKGFVFKTDKTCDISSPFFPLVSIVITLSFFLISRLIAAGTSKPSSWIQMTSVFFVSS